MTKAKDLENILIQERLKTLQNSPLSRQAAALNPEHPEIPESRDSVSEDDFSIGASSTSQESRKRGHKTK
jgi:hypothetical protein